MPKKDLLERREEAIALYEHYGNLLSAERKRRFEAYYFEDLSLGEIALEEEVSRSAVFDSLQKTLDHLSHYEEQLHFLEKEEKLRQILTRYEANELTKESFLKEINDAL